MSFGTMVSQILTDINRGSQHAPRVKQAICDAITRFEAKKLGWNQRRQETAIQRGDEYVALPEDWVEAGYLRIQDGTRRDPLTKRSVDWVEEHVWSDDDFGFPTDYCIEARQIRFNPIPDRSYSLVMLFQCKFTDVSLSASDEADNVWTNEGAILTRTWAHGEVLFKYIRGDQMDDGQALVQYAETTLLMEFEARGAREQSSNRLRAHL